MAKIHLLLKKEDIDQQKMKENKVAVIFDVLLATSTITAALQFGAKEVIPVLNKQEALEISKTKEPGSYVLVGEQGGLTLDGFFAPNPLALKEHVQGKTVILSTTNGTVAIKHALAANKVYMASILNGQSVANVLKENDENETILLVCSGSSGEFNLEDFYGAGYLIDCLQKEQPFELTDAALTAYHFYRSNQGKAEELLRSSQVGKMLRRFGMDDDIHFVSQKSIIDLVPFLKDDRSVVKLGGVLSDKI